MAESKPKSPRAAVIKAAGKYAYLLFAVIALAALSYEAMFLAVAYLLFLAVLILIVAVRPTPAFPIHFLWILCPGVLIAILNNQKLETNIPDSAVMFIICALAIIPAFPFIYLDSKNPSVRYVYKPTD